MNTSRAKRLVAAAGIAGALSLGTAGVADAATPVPATLSLQVTAPTTAPYLGAAPVLRSGRGPVDVEIGSTE